MKIFATALLVCAVASPALAQAPLTIFGNAVPAHPVDPDTNAVTLGVKWFSKVAGTVSGIRFYRGHTNGAGYTVKLFTTGGQLLASKKITSDSCKVPCWEQATFAAPISIATNTTYIAAYYTANGRYAADNNGLVNGIANAPLYAQASVPGNGNGVYTYSTGFPNQTYQSSNYYVDVLFASTAPTLMLNFNPPSPTIDPAAPPGTVISQAVATWSDGSPFSGTLTFGPPYGNDNGLVALKGNSVIVNGDLSSLANTQQQATVTATQ